MKVFKSIIIIIILMLIFSYFINGTEKLIVISLFGLTMAILLGLINILFGLN